jgi:hypothetical protein
MTRGNAAKSDFLGEPYGTACSRLRKELLFLLACETRKSACFRCGLPIASIGEFSIDHKQEWLYVNPELFWDLDNVAFSHLSCNIRSQRKPTRIVCPSGHSWCQKCEACLPEGNFYKQSPHSRASRQRTRNGLRQSCKACDNKLRTEQRRRNRA